MNKNYYELWILNLCHRLTFWLVSTLSFVIGQDTKRSKFIRESSVYRGECGNFGLCQHVRVLGLLLKEFYDIVVLRGVGGRTTLYQHQTSLWILKKKKSKQYG